MLAPIYAWITAIAESGDVDPAQVAQRAPGPSARALNLLSGGRGWRGWGLAAAFPAIVLALNAAGRGLLRANVAGPELARAGLTAFGRSLERLRVDAAHVSFGHTHRAGPLPG